jgi:hypothetical protein
MAITTMTNENKILWHYTTMSGLKGIVENGNIHATNIRYLNDSQEFDFGLDYLKKVILSNEIDSQVENIPLNEDMSLLDHLITLRINYILSCFRDDPSRSSEYFVTSFSSNPDVLSQWRAYGKEKVGYSIKFDSASLHYPSDPMLTLIHKIEYVNPADSSIARAFIDKTINDIKTDDWHSMLLKTMPWLEQNDRSEYQKMLLKMSELDDSHSVRMTNMIDIIEETATFPTKVDMNDVDPVWYTAICTVDFWCIAPSIKNVALTWKHYSFSEEDEYRLVYEFNESIATKLNLSAKKFREGKTFLIPYIEIPYDFRKNEIIQEVVVGPCPHPDEAVSSIRQFLDQNINKNFTVNNSKIPYRYW